MARRIPYTVASAALNKQLAGEALSRREQLALTNLQSRLGLTKPLADYAPRTRRRYLAAAREGLTAREANSREWSDRTGSLTGEARLRKIEQLRSDIESSSVELARDKHSREDIQELIDLYGAPFVLRLLNDQRDSIAHYQSGDTSPGKRRWENRTDLLSQYRMMEADDATDPYFYYHGTLS